MVKTLGSMLTEWVKIFCAIPVLILKLEMLS